MISRPSLRRRRALRVAVLALLAVTALAASLHLLDRGRDDGYRREGWPLVGQAAYVIGNGRPAASPHQHPVPIASVAKVMTAYLVLKHDPLRAGDSGRRFVVDQDDVADAEARRHGNQSVVAVRAGEQLTERDALMAILLPSANNVAVLVARQVDGSVAAFVAEMNRTARALGMSHTTYTDPSGYDDGTVSTALDQLRLARVVAKDQTLAAMMATRSYSLPVAGEVTNTNALLGQDGFVGMKTGSDQAAGGCLMFRAVWPAGNGSRSVIGVVLGQRGDDLLAAGLSAARRLVARLAARAHIAGISNITYARATPRGLDCAHDPQPTSITRSPAPTIAGASVLLAPPDDRHHDLRMRRRRGDEPLIITSDHARSSWRRHRPSLGCEPQKSEQHQRPSCPPRRRRGIGFDAFGGAPVDLVVLRAPFPFLVRCRRTPSPGKSACGEGR